MAADSFNSDREDYRPLEDVLDSVFRWASRAPKGIAMVVYRDESVRARAEAMLIDRLHQVEIECKRLNLLAVADPEEAVMLLVRTVKGETDRILMVTGFAPIFASMGDDWRNVNWRREQLHPPGTRQVWWIPEEWELPFRQYGPDLYDWFLVKERILDTDYRPPVYTEAPSEPINRPIDEEALAKARRQSDSYLRRFQKGLEIDAALVDLFDLIPEVARPLFRAGQGREGAERARSMLDQLEGRLSDPSNLADPILNSRRIQAGREFANSAQFDLAARVLAGVPASNAPKLSAHLNQALGDIALSRSNHDEARKRFDTALELYQMAGDVHGKATSIQGLGNIALGRFNHDEARRRYDAALTLFRAVGDVLGEANCTQSLGELALGRSDYVEARSRFLDSLSKFRFISDPFSIGNTYLLLGRLDEAEGKNPTENWARAAAAWRSIGREDLVRTHLPNLDTP